MGGMYNGHADVTALLDSTGTIVATYYYDAFGSITEQTGNVNNNVTYAGYQYDTETGLYYLMSRMYDPTIARFLQEDTYRGSKNDPLSLNLYTYCHNEPLMYWDYDGHLAAGQVLSYSPNVKSADVKQLQQALINAGYSVGSKGADGYFGKDTLAAVNAYKADNKLQNNTSLTAGKVGETTWQNLGLSLSGGTSSSSSNSGVSNKTVVPPTTPIKTPPVLVVPTTGGVIVVSVPQVTLTPETRTATFALEHPIAAPQIGEFKKGSTNISTNAVRFSTNDLGLQENNDNEGSQVNAFRHALWQATITKKFSPEIATEAGNAHEVNPYVIDDIKDFSNVRFSTLSQADQYIDLLNNINGREVGKNVQSYSMKDIAIATLNYYHDKGLWVAEKQNDGTYAINQTQLSDAQYNVAYNRLCQLDNNGYTQEQLQNRK